MQPNEQVRFDTLYQKHLTALKLQGKAAKTIEGYARAVRRIANTLDRCPDDLTADDLKTYFAALLECLSWSGIKIERNGLRFFHEHVLQRAMPWIDIVKPPVVSTLPDILTHDEIARIIAITRALRFQCFWFVAYTLGLRLSETLNLKVGDIDAERMAVHVRKGKGSRDRFVMLPPMTHRVLQHLWRSHRHPVLLFPGRFGPEGSPAAGVMDAGTTQRAFKRAVLDCGIRKTVSIHSLRHSYATRLIEVGVNLRGVQEQLGHASPATTARYVRMTEKCQDDNAVLIGRMVDDLVTALRTARVKS